MIHIGILGDGNISETHASAAREIEGVEIAAIYGERHDKASRLSELYGGAVYKDLDDFLNHKPLDIVAIGSPSGMDAEQASAAARRGLLLQLRSFDRPFSLGGAVWLATGAALLSLMGCVPLPNTFTLFRKRMFRVNPSLR